MRIVCQRAAFIAGIGIKAGMTAATLALVISLAGTTAVLAQQQIAQTQSAAPDQSDQAAPAAKPHHKSSKLTTPTNPDLDSNDQLAPSQMQQQMPAAVSQPMSAPVKPTKPAVRESAASPAAPAAPAAATGPKAGAAIAAARIVACNGAFSKDSSHLRLAMTFDTKNVTFTDVDSSAGTKVPASVLFAGDPKRRLEVWWANPAARNQTYLIVINGKSTWTAPGGMKLGLSLAQLEKLNHKPFKIKGFDKDGTATVSDWDGGALATLTGGCKSGMSMQADPKAAPDAVSALTADKEYSSSDPAMRAVKPVVSEILIGY
jgi:hypothetical protein